jgi:hypothetical protein
MQHFFMSWCETKQLFFHNNTEIQIKSDIFCLNAHSQEWRRFIYYFWLNRNLLAGFCWYILSKEIWFNAIKVFKVLLQWQDYIRLKFIIGLSGGQMNEDLIHLVFLTRQPATFLNDSQFELGHLATPFTLT